MNNNPANALETMARTLILQSDVRTLSFYHEQIAMLRKVVPAFSLVTDAQADFVARTLEKKLGVVMKLGSSLHSEKHAPWLQEARNEMDQYYWERYKQYLESIEKLPPAAIYVHDSETDQFLDSMGNPKNTEEPRKTRGLIMGYVQSGKTTSYSGLACKAADAGYRVIIIMAGVHNILRNQTQVRLDRNFVGIDSTGWLANKASMPVGVGLIDNRRSPTTLTNSLKDFSKAAQSGVGLSMQPNSNNEPLLFVIKKNITTLRNLYDWLNAQNAASATKQISLPMLLIDDEADNASINIKYRDNPAIAKQEVAKTNESIRRLLSLFRHSSYVGYTATPFANVFIPVASDEILGEDLFPEDFIFNLEAPSNYVGPQKMFIDEPENFIRDIQQADSDPFLPIKHKADFDIGNIPVSLLDALRAFIITGAIRHARGHENFHSSMLVNVSWRVSIHPQVASIINRKLESLQASIKMNAALSTEKALLDPQIHELHRVWQEEYLNTEFTWDHIKEFLHRAAKPIVVKEINSKSPGNLNYGDYDSTGLSVIVVGGFSLSRGMTLEGLSISYVLRSPSTEDTLMQMGRWFGYRPGYEDLCRVWMPEELQQDFATTAETIEELRMLFTRMAQAGAPPREFGVRVRNHPGRLMITARNRMGWNRIVKIGVDLKAKLIETFAIHSDTSIIQRNFDTLEQLGKSLGNRVADAAWDKVSNSGYLIRHVPVDIVTDFLDTYRNHVLSVHTHPQGLLRYIEDRSKTELAQWDILFASKQPTNNPEALVYYPLGFPIYCRERTFGKKTDIINSKVLYLSGIRQRRLGSPGDESAGLENTTERQLIDDEYLKAHPGVKTVPDAAYRVKKKRPLLILHVLTGNPRDDADDETKETLSAYNQAYLLAWSISFPETNLKPEFAEYVLNKDDYEAYQSTFWDDNDDDGSEEDNDTE